MRWLNVVAFAVAGVCVGAASTHARPDTPPQIKFDPKQAVDFAGRVDAKGTYSLPKDSGLTIESIVVESWPIQGGKMVSGKCKWKDGKWPGYLAGLPIGKLNFHAVMTVKDAKGL